MSSVACVDMILSSLVVPVNINSDLEHVRWVATYSRRLCHIKCMIPRSGFMFTAWIYVYSVHDDATGDDAIVAIPLTENEITHVHRSVGNTRNVAIQEM